MSAIDKLAGYEAILTHHAIVTPQVNKLKAAKPLEFYALIAFPAAAQADLWAILVERATAAFGGMHQDVQHGIKTNATSKKPIPGVPGDALIVRAASQFAPEVYDADGSLLSQQNPAHIAAIKAKFFAGTKVRAILTPFHWTHPTGGRGISFNLAGIMLVPSDAQRLAIGGVDTAGAFAKYAAAGAGSAANTGAASAPAANFAAGGNPGAFGSGAPAANSNPFAQAAGGAPAGGANPFL